MQPVVAHSVGTLLDLPVDLPALLLTGAGALVGTAAWLTRRDAASHTPPPRRQPPTALSVGATGRRVGGAAARSLGIVVLLGMLALALLGPAGPDRNALPRAVLVLIWGGLVPLSLVGGPVGRAASPFPPLAGGLRRLAGHSTGTAAAGGHGASGPAAGRDRDSRMGRWPAAGFAVVVAAASQFSVDAVAGVGVGLLCYTALQVVGGMVAGPRWFPGGEAVASISEVVGAVAPLGPRPDQRWGLRDPLAGLTGVGAPPGTVAFVGVLVGATYFEALAEAWSVQGFAAGLIGTLVASAACAGVLRLGVVRPFLVPALMPVGAAYALQLYLVPLLLEGRLALAQLTDPLGTGDALPALVASGVRLPVPAVLVAGGLFVAFVGLHVVAVVVAHRAALSRFDLRGARAVQFPLRAVLLTSLVLGLWVPTLGA